MGDYQLFHGDCLDILPTLAAGSVDAVITDPPYGLGFMGKDWDHGVPGERFWAEVLRVAKPGAFLLAFGGTRTFHRLVCAIEDAGWEVRDTLCWLYGSGFPKSLDISKALDGVIGKQAKGFKYKGGNLPTNGGSKFRSDHPEYQPYAPATDAAKLWHGYGTALKPAFEPICLAMKPLDGTFAENALKHGVAGLWIDRCRIATDELKSGTYQRKHSDSIYNDTTSGLTRSFEYDGSKGRWPANLIHDGSDEATAGMGDAARYFYCAKASRAERNAGLEGMEELSQMRSDLTEDERQYVMSELQKEGLV